jgi:hypothetical protein
MPNPWVSLIRHDQLIPANQAVNEKEQWGKGLEEEEEKIQIFSNRYLFATYTYICIT